MKTLFLYIIITRTDRTILKNLCVQKSQIIRTRIKERTTSAILKCRKTAPSHKRHLDVPVCSLACSYRGNCTQRVLNVYDLQTRLRSNLTEITRKKANLKSLQLLDPPIAATKVPLLFKFKPELAAPILSQSVLYYVAS